ncbi:DUF1269 domain-containing protein [Mangrovicoccus ximenensis]|uniref:DUF1269 domain-containing protein n=1 Tax=Mangrovicoccus ximenensis TaxID=1911570 RepID=UPI000D33F771|nr:DUF1269 domain-containing protein [Mangrovicoccus ximenensis]
MSDLIVLGFDDEATGFELRAELIKLQKEYLLEIEDAVVVTRDASGDVKLHQEVNLTAAGAVGGAFWGLLIGVVFLNPLLGVAAGAGAGALSGALTDLGVNDKFMKEMGGSLQPGGSMVFVLVRRATGDKVLERLEGFRARGRVIQTSLTKTDEASLRALIEDNDLAPTDVPAAPA